jgi:hypothetical protein
MRRLALRLPLKQVVTVAFGFGHFSSLLLSDFDLDIPSPHGPDSIQWKTNIETSLKKVNF